jgi:hypothetical protein
MFVLLLLTLCFRRAKFMRTSKFLQITSLLLLCTACSLAVAKTYANDESALQSQSLNIQVQDEQSGMPFPVFRRGNSFNGYVGGETGHPYKLSLTNTGYQRVMVVVSVDGVNVITGQNASIRQSGYVIAPHSTTVIDGWRKSMSNVSKFVFSDPSDSYASQTNRPANVGIIGFAVFQEAPPVNSPEMRAESMGRAESASPARSADKALNSLGTAHGQIIESQATTTSFKAASDKPLDLIELRYDTLQNLEKIGVAIVRKSAPSAFPADGFVPDPPMVRIVR